MLSRVASSNAARLPIHAPVLNLAFFSSFPPKLACQYLSLPSLRSYPRDRARALRRGYSGAVAGARPPAYAPPRAAHSGAANGGSAEEGAAVLRAPLLAEDGAEADREGGVEEGIFGGGSVTHANGGGMHEAGA